MHHVFGFEGEEEYTGIPPWSPRYADILKTKLNLNRKKIIINFLKRLIGNDKNLR